MGDDKSSEANAEPKRPKNYCKDCRWRRHFTYDSLCADNVFDWDVCRHPSIAKACDIDPLSGKYAAKKRYTPCDNRLIMLDGDCEVCSDRRTGSRAIDCHDFEARPPEPPKPGGFFAKLLAIFRERT